MKWIALSLALVGCQRGDASAPPPGTSGPPSTGGAVTQEYRADITNLCDSVKLSGADKIEDDSRMVTIAMWLGPHITTPQGHEFLVSIHALEGEAHALALDNEARRVGLAGCALSAEWRK
jgi:hypothetical protein